MDGAGDEFLAGAGFTSDEDGGIVTRHALDHAEELTHGLAADHGDQVANLDTVLRSMVWIFRLRRLPLRANPQSFPGHRKQHPSPGAFHSIFRKTEKVTFVWPLETKVLVEIK